MRRASFRMVAATDGAPPTPSGYCFYLVAHAIATVLLLITFVAAVWQFMDWIVTPSCLADSSLSSVSSSVGRPPPVTLAASQRYSARLESALTDRECPCPHER